MAMDSEKLTARIRQPGHDRSFVKSETLFIGALREILDDEDWEIVDHPRDLAKIISGKYGVVPEASIRHRGTGNVMYFEVKKQGPAGNADERACKHHTVQFYKELHKVTQLDYHPFATIMCQNLATDVRYTLKHPFYFEEDHYFLWVDYDIASLKAYIEKLAAQWLATGREVEPDTIPQ